MHCVNLPGNLAGNFSDVTVLERQTAPLRWQHQQQQQLQGCSNYSIGNNFCGAFGEDSSVNIINNIQDSLMGNDLNSMFMVNRVIKPDPGLQNGWAEMGKIGSSGYGIGTGVEANFGISKTLSCPPTVAAKPAVAVPVEGKGKESLVSGTSGSQVGKESSKKRKVDHVHNIKDEDNTKNKKIKGCPEDVKSKITEQVSNKTENKYCNNCTNSKETSATTSKENSKVTEVQKPDYIHVRARRGQATDSHSLAERVRREKISERMKFLQDLVPGCNKITGKAGMLDEIINYVQSLQRQVEFLSMKLAAVSPRLDFDVDSIFGKELIPACTAGFPTFDLSSEIASPSFLQINPMHQVVSCSGMEMGIQRTLSAPVPIPETLLNASCFDQIQPPPPTWDADLQNLYDVEFHQARTPFPSHQYTGPESNLKMEL